MAQALSEPIDAAAPVYRTLSPRVAPALTVAGGIFALGGGLGLWVRALEVTPSGAPHYVGSISGASNAWGWVIAILGAATVAAVSQWSSKAVARASIPVALSIVTVVLIGLRLDWAGEAASALAMRAGTQAGRAFTTYHSGFGWGAWLLALGAVALVLGTVAGVLRALDVRRGLGT